MSAIIRAAFLNILFILPIYAIAQKDSSHEALKQINIEKFAKQASDKIALYDHRITSKTKKTLVKLARWESKLHSAIQKADPSLASQLFSPTSISFQKMLQQYEAGEVLVNKQVAAYDAYRDKLNTSLQYIQKHKDLVDTLSINKTVAKVEDLEKSLASTDALQKMIKERKAALVQATLKAAGKSKYLAKISKESFYYTETLKNYKDLFHDSKKQEKLALEILNKIPAFQKFFRENNALASLFGIPGSSLPPTGGGGALAGLQTRASVNAIIQTRLSAGGPNAQEVFTQQISVAQAELSKLKDKVMKAGGGSSDMEMPEFKPNMQKTKTFKQRLEFGSNFQFVKPNGYFPSTTKIGLSMGYKLNDKSVVGLGAIYIMGMGRIEKIKLATEGMGVRSFLDWQLKKQFFISAGYELNFLKSSLNINQSDEFFKYPSALIGLGKKYKISKKVKGNIQILYDFLYASNLPVSQPFLYRIGYTIK